MDYIYGDATQAPFSVDYIQLLRDVIDYAVEHLSSEQERHSLGKRELSLRAVADGEIKRVEELGRITVRAMEAANVGGEGTFAAHCAQAIVHVANEQVRLAIEAVKAGLSTQLGQLAELEQGERQRSQRALEKLLLQHDLPDSSFSLQLTQAGGQKYVGRCATTSAMGVDAVFELEVGKDSAAFTPIARVERFVQSLDLHAPEAGGFFRKETRLKPQRVDKLHVVELAVGEGGAFKLRVGPDGSGAGFEFKLDEQRRVKASYLNESGVAAAYEPPAEDAAKIVALYDRLAESAADARFCRKKLLEASLDGEAYAEHEEPTVLVERLIEEMAPVVQEIARRSKSTEELVIKRVTGDKRREEIFIAKSELVAKLVPVPTNLRRLFIPLGLEEAKPSTRPPPPVAPKLPSKRPPPIPEVADLGSEPALVEAAPAPEVNSGDWEIPEPEAAPASQDAPRPSKPAIFPPASRTPAAPPASPGPSSQKTTK
jgi:hypothetical protein